MPTPLDRALNSKETECFPRYWVTMMWFFNSKLTAIAFGALVTAGAAWSIWGTDMFPAQPDPTGDPEKWTEEEMRTWLRKRNLHPDYKDSRAQLLERIKANMRISR